MHEDNRDCCKQLTTTKNITINRFNIYYDVPSNQYLVIDCSNTTVRTICTCSNKIDAQTICKLLNF